MNSTECAKKEGKKRTTNTKQFLKTRYKPVNSGFFRILFSLIINMMLSISYGNSQPRLNVFLSFEDKEEIKELKTSPGIMLKQSDRYTTWMKNSLEVFFPKGGGEIRLNHVQGDWRSYTSFHMFAWSEQPYELAVTLQDAGNNSYCRTYPLRRGANHIQMDLRQAQSIDWSQMKSVSLNGPVEGHLFLDYIALDIFNEFLEARGRYDFNLKKDIQTPHLNFAVPFTGGPINAYALHNGKDGRGIIELAQRLELNFRATTIGFQYGFGEFYNQRNGIPYYTYVLDDLLYGSDIDVILWPAIEPWENYPQDIRDEVMRQVKEEGKGLIFFMPYTGQDDGEGLWNLSPLTHFDRSVMRNEGDQQKEDHSLWKKSKDHYITRGLDLNVFPQGKMTAIPSRSQGDVLIETEEGTPVLSVWELGKGRVAAFGYKERGMIPMLNIWETGLHYRYWDYLWSMVARTVVWAARREPEAFIAGVQRQGDKVEVSLGGSVPSGHLTGQLIDSYGNKLVNFNEVVNKGARHVEVDLSGYLFGGERNILDLKLVGSDGSLDWTSLGIYQEPVVIIKELGIDREQIELGEEVNAAFTLSSDRPVSCIVTAGLYDNYDRLLSVRKENIKLEGNISRSWVFSSKGAESHLARVKLKVEGIDGRVYGRDEEEVFLLQDRDWDHFDIVMYRFGEDPMPGIWPEIDRQLRTMHVTTLSSYSNEHSKHANYMVQAQTRVSGQESPDSGPDREYYDQMKHDYLQTGDKMKLIRKYCLNDPAYHTLIKKELKNLCSPWIPFSPLSYYVFEEPSFTVYDDALDICFCEHCMREMRKWLQQEYSNLDALNKQWGSNFKKWDDVLPDDYKEAQKRGNYSSWADHRTFMEYTYANSYKMIRDELWELDPGAIVLNSGTQASSPHNGCDYSRLNLYTEHLNAYGNYGLHRSMNPDVKISGGAGYGAKGKYVLNNFYRNLFDGANGGQYIFWQYCTIDPDLTLNQSAKDMIEGLEELVGQGIGKLVGQGTLDNNGIAIHYSYPSLHGTWIVDGKVLDRVAYNVTTTSPSCGRFESNFEGWQKILQDCEMQFDFLAYSHVEDGQLISKGYDTFVLPMSVALSDEEIDQIALFVEAGGTVIADGLPGVMDEHCAFRNSNKLQEIFGIKTAVSNPQEIIKAEGDLDLELSGAHLLKEKEGKPELLVNEYGKGKAYLLNYFIHDYISNKNDNRHTDQLNDMLYVLEAAGKSPMIELTGEDGKKVEGCSNYLFNSGSTRFLGLSPDMERQPEEQIKIYFGKEYFIYDVRHRRYLGRGDQLRATIEAGVPNLYALVEGRIDKLEIEAPDKAKLGEEVDMKIKVGSPAGFSSVACIKVTDPEGNTLHYYGENVDIRNGVASFSFSTSLNDLAGEWKVEVTETISGERGQAIINIK